LKEWEDRYWRSEDWEDFEEDEFKKVDWKKTVHVSEDDDTPLARLREGPDPDEEYPCR
jgi:hypothetical protein